MEAIKNFERYCSSEDLSIDGIKWALGYFVSHDRLHESNFLHKVCMNPKVTLEIVEYLVELFPEMVGTERDIDIDERTFKGAYLSHIACRNEHCPNSVVKFLMEGNNDVLTCICSMENDYEGLPLHYYLSRHQNVDIEIVKYMVEKYPDALKMFGESTFTPLHILLANKHVGAMFDIVKYLIDYAPISLRLKDRSFNRLPLHTACKNQSITKEIIQCLVNKWQDALHVECYVGLIAIHLFCRYGDMLSNNDAIEILQLILESYPDGAIQANRDGVLPIHYAARNNRMSVEFIEILIDARPELVSQVDDSGDLPFHDACSFGHIDIVKYLYGLNPDSIRTICSHSELPLHCACRNEDPEVLKYVLGLYPEAIHLRGEYGLPIHVALTSGTVGEHTKEIIKFLALHDPDCVSKADIKGCLPLHLLCGYDLSYGAELLFDLHPDAILVRDERGRLPIDVAEEEADELADEE
eukprot:scaffold78695_cov23-Cyclotella_meneghiniana.AAC.1